MAQRASLSFFALLFFGCFPSGEGVDPPANRSVYFPVGLALDADASHLYIANSDFDLQYNAGTVESWDLESLRQRMPIACTSDAGCPDGKVCDTDGSVPSHWCVSATDHKVCPFSREQFPSERSLYPGRCAAIDPQRKEGALDPIRPPTGHVVQIGAFATDIIYRARPGDPDRTGRLFVPVRGDATLHWIDVDRAGGLQCGGAACDDAHRRGNDPAAENTRGVALLPEPFAIDADESGHWLMVTNQTSAAVGLLENRWSAGAGYDNGPSYQYTVAGLPGEPMGVASVPRARATFAQPDLPEFLVGYRGIAALDLLRVYPDDDSAPPRPYAKAPYGQPILTNSNGADSRGLAVDGSLRRQSEATCASLYGVSEECAAGADGCAAPPDGYGTCLQSAAAIPLDVLVTNRAPASLLVGRTQQVIASPSSYDLPAFTGVVPLGFGPSRVVFGDVTNADGEREQRAFAISFDTHRVVVYDPARQRVETEIMTGRGPQAMVIDPAHGYGYVAHFTDSYIGVVDLDQRHPTYGVIIAMVEPPMAPRASK